MKAVLLNGGQPESCYPVTCTRALAACSVANRPLADVQAARLTAAGFDVSGSRGTGPALYVRGDAWLSVDMLVRLAKATAPQRVDDGLGGGLAWIGDSESVPAKATPVTADSGTFAIRFPWDLLRVNEVALGEAMENRIEGEMSSAAHVEGRLTLGRGSRILPGVYIEGVVAIGADCKIGPNCYLRGSTSIGDGCHIGQAVEIKNSILMKGASIGHLSYCGDSIIGEKANVGAGTIPANFRHDGKNHRSMVDLKLVDTGRRKFGTVLGDHAHTGIHTSIYPGRKLWPNVSTLPGDIVKHDLRQ